MDRPREVDPTPLPSVEAVCGHRSRHVVRVYASAGWTSVCLGCWRERRSFYRSLNQYASERAQLHMTEASNLDEDEVAV